MKALDRVTQAWRMFYETENFELRKASITWGKLNWRRVVEVRGKALEAEDKARSLGHSEAEITEAADLAKW